MSSNSTSYNNGQQMQVNTNLAKLFPYGKELKSYNYTNATGAQKTWLAGTVMGVVKATGKVLPCVSTAVDGSQYPIGVLARDYVVEDTETVAMAIAIRGDVRTDMVLLQGAETLSTVLGDRRLGEILEDRLILRSVSNNTKFDNAIV
jgi:hypothetical protein